MQLNYYVLGQRIQKISKNKRISQAVIRVSVCGTGTSEVMFIHQLSRVRYKGYESRNFCWHRQCAGGVD